MTTKQNQRAARLMPNGIPRWIRIYDNDGESLDRYTVVFTGRYPKTCFVHICMNGNPYHPAQGICQHGESEFSALDTPNGKWPPAIGRKCYLGRRIEWEDLPEDCQKVVKHDYNELWSLYRDV